MKHNVPIMDLSLSHIPNKIQQSSIFDVVIVTVITELYVLKQFVLFKKVCKREELSRIFQLLTIIITSVVVIIMIIVIIIPAFLEFIIKKYC